MIGILSIVFLVLVFPVQKFVGKMSSRHTFKRIQQSDERIKLINEIIEGIRIIKMYGWEEAIRNIIERIRKIEISENIKSATLIYTDKSISISSVLVSGALTFIIIHYEGSYELNSAKIFSTIEMLSYLRTNLMMYSGYAFAFIFELQIFLRRFIDIYNIKDVKLNNEQLSGGKENLYQIQSDEITKFDQFNAYWKIPAHSNKQNKSPNKALNSSISNKANLNTQPISPNKIDEQKDAKESSNLKEQNSDIKPTLKNLSFSIKYGELIAIVGKIGSGKTTFLSCFLNEIPYSTGHFKIQQTNKQGDQLKLAYVEQEPYIFSSTVKENILFGYEYDPDWYSQVVKACCLLPDFEQLEKGDLTQVGERGVNLSGGQKARICLARAVYRKADLYLLDDPLSAVDSKVAQELFTECIQGVLKDKTVILVTHQIHYTRNCDKIVILNQDGSVNNIGKFIDLQDELKTLAAGQLKFENPDEHNLDDKEENKEQNHNMNLSQQNNNNDEVENKLMRKEIDDDFQFEVQDKIEQSRQQNVQQKQTINENVDITVKTYVDLIKLINKVFKFFPLLVIILFILAECAFTAFNRTLGFYDQTSDESMDKLFGLLIGFSFLYMLLNFLKQSVVSAGIQLGSKRLHKKMLKSLIRAPVLFFDRISSGSLMNKFSNDINLIDNQLQFAANDSLDIMANFLNLLITCCVFNPYIIIPAVIELILLFGFLLYCKNIINGTRQMDLSYKTPMYAHFQSTLQGSIAIKVYQQNKIFIKQMENHCNNSLQANQAFWMVSRFFGGFTQTFAIICSAIGVYLILSLFREDTAKQAQSLTYYMLTVDTIQWCLRQILTTDSIMSSYERIQILVKQESEAPLLVEEKTEEQKQQLQNWPSEGNIAFKKVVMRYSKEMNPVLKGLSFNIESGQKIGCVGRTGAGKSSVVQVLFRLTEPDQGSEIYIDGVNICKLGLHTLRQKISIIPQVPFVFGGTIRRNLDPFNKYSDDQIWEALQLVELDKYVKSTKNGLLTDMSIVSSVFSVGQKQLICLARALLKQNKILVLDEATANVDMETDDLIQKTIRSKFLNSTVLTIAHRLNTIADYDKIIVMNDGVVAEYDSPFNLLANSVEDENITKQTIFAQMVKNTGKNNSENIFQLSKKKYMELQNKGINQNLQKSS